MSPSLESPRVRLWFVLTFHISQGERMQTSSVVSSVALKAMWAMRARRTCSAHVNHHRKKQNKNRSRSELNDSRLVQTQKTPLQTSFFHLFHSYDEHTNWLYCTSDGMIKVRIKLRVPLTLCGATKGTISPSSHGSAQQIQTNSPCPHCHSTPSTSK